jgi:hypothetical protein
MSQYDPGKVLAALNHLEQARIASGVNGQRQFTRFTIRGEAELQNLDPAHRDDPPLPIHLRDVGRAGLGFICQQSLPQGSIWRVSFSLRGHPIAYQTITIRHCSQVHGGVYLVGAQFCADSGLMVLLGVDPARLREDENPQQAEGDCFIAPSEVA